MIIRDICGHGDNGVPDGQYYGIEIEVEDCIVPDISGNSAWNCISDGSLRNSGVEFVSRPVDVATAMMCIDQFYAWKEQFRYSTGIRTSTHIHVNVLHLEPQALVAAITTYALLEPLLFRVCGREREENIYCVPWYRGPQDTAYVRELASDNSYRLANACKYSAFYIEPVLRFGTVEFRAAPVFDTSDMTKFWLKLCGSVIYSGAEYETGEAVIDAYDLLGASDFVLRVLGHAAGDRLLGFLEKSAEDIIEEADSMSVAEQCVPSLYTYKVRPVYESMPFTIEGNAQSGYHTIQAPRNRGDVPVWSMDTLPDDEAEISDWDGDYEEDE